MAYQDIGVLANVPVCMGFDNALDRGPGIEFLDSHDYHSIQESISSSMLREGMGC